jgi:hypothetical protein
MATPPSNAAAAIAPPPATRSARLTFNTSDYLLA